MYSRVSQPEMSAVVPKRRNSIGPVGQDLVELRQKVPFKMVPSGSTTENTLFAEKFLKKDGITMNSDYILCESQQNHSPQKTLKNLDHPYNSSSANSSTEGSLLPTIHLTPSEMVRAPSSFGLEPTTSEVKSPVFEKGANFLTKRCHQPHSRNVGNS